MYGTDFGENVAKVVKAILLVFIISCVFVYTKGLNDKEVFEMRQQLIESQAALDAKEKELERFKKDVKMLEDIKKIQEENIEKLEEKETIIIVDNNTRKDEAKKKRETINSDKSKTDMQKTKEKLELDFDFIQNSFCKVNTEDPTCKQ